MNDSGKMPNEEIVRLRTVAFTAQEMAYEIVSRSDAEIARLRAELDKAEREKDALRTEKENARIWSTKIMDSAYAVITRQEADLTEVREVVKPLLDHYLECYEGNYDDLANAAVAFLERTNCNNS